MGSRLDGLQMNSVLAGIPESPGLGRNFLLFDRKETAFDCVDSIAVRMQTLMKERGVDSELNW